MTWVKKPARLMSGEAGLISVAKGFWRFALRINCLFFAVEMGPEMRTLAAFPRRRPTLPEPNDLT